MLEKTTRDFFDIFRRLKNRDFSGNTGLAIKNSIYQFSTNFVLKIGSLVFTVIIARLLMPELFGLYNLALSTILIFFVISNMGIGPALVRFVSKELEKRKQKNPGAYVFYIGKVKALLYFVSALILILSARFISNVYYQKPIYLALIAGAFYIFFYGLATFFEYILQASNLFNKIFYKEIIFQILRVIVVPLAILLALKNLLSNDQVLFYLFIALGISYFLISAFMFFFQIKKINYLSNGQKPLNRLQKKATNKFLAAVSITIFSGLFFEYIDKIMLGHYVPAEFIGYYSAALGLIGTFIALEGFGAALLPIFSRAGEKTLNIGLSKALKVVLFFSLIVVILSFVLAPVIVNAVYGSEYAPASGMLKLLSVLLIPLPLISIFSTFFISKGTPQVITKLLLASTVINITLNYILITSLLPYGNIMAVYGAGIATIISQFFYLGGLIFTKKNA